MSTTTSRQGLTLPALTDTADITVITGDLTTIDTEGVFLNIANTAASGMTLDMTAAGANAHIVPNGAGITPTTDGAIAYDTTAEALVVGSDGSTLTIATTTSTFVKVAVSGLTGATAASRYVGATASGAPASGTFAVGDFVIDQTGKIFVCTVAGSPGTWVNAGSPMTTAGDTIYGGSSGVPTRLAVGTAYQALRVNSGATAPEWAGGAGGMVSFQNSGDVNKKAQMSTSAGTSTFNASSGANPGYFSGPSVSFPSTFGSTPVVVCSINTYGAGNAQAVSTTGFTGGGSGETAASGSGALSYLAVG